MKISADPKSLTSNAIWSSLGIIWPTILSILYTPFLLHLLGKLHFGYFLLVSSVAGIAGLFDFGMSDVLVRFVAYHFKRDDRKAIGEMVSTVLCINLITGLTAALAVALAAPLVAPLIGFTAADAPLGVLLLRITSVGIFLQAIGRVFSAIPLGLQRNDLALWIILVQATVQVGGTILLLMAGFGLLSVVLWGNACSIIPTIFGFLAGRRMLPGSALGLIPSRAAWKSILPYGSWSSVSQIMSVIWRESDRILIGHLAGPEAISAYAIPQGVAFKGLDFLGRAGGILFPRFSSVSDPESNARLFLASTWGLLWVGIVLFVPLATLFPDFLRLWISPGFASGSGSLAVLISLSCLARGWAQPFFALFRSQNPPVLFTAFLSGGALLNIAANVLLIPRFGAFGAACAFSMTPLWEFIAMVVAWKWVLRMDRIWPLLRTTVIPVIMGYVSYLGFRSILGAIGNDFGWLMLAVLGISFAIASAFAVILVDLLLNGTGSQARLFLRRYFGKPRGVGSNGAAGIGSRQDA